MENTNFWSGFDKTAKKKAKPAPSEKEMSKAQEDGFGTVDAVAGGTGLVAYGATMLLDNIGLRASPENVRKLRDTMGVSKEVKQFADATAHFDPIDNSVNFMAGDSLGTAAHELGHSTEKSLQNMGNKARGAVYDSKWANLANVEMAMRALLPITAVGTGLGTAYLAKKIVKQEAEDKRIDYAPAAFATLLSAPTLISEGRASITGLSGVYKNHGAMETLKQAPSLATAFLTYAAPAIGGIAGSVYLRRLRNKQKKKH